MTSGYMRPHKPLNDRSGDPELNQTATRRMCALRYVTKTSKMCHPEVLQPSTSEHSAIHLALKVFP